MRFCLGLQTRDELVLGRNCVNRRDPISTGGHDPFTAGIFCEPKDEAFYLGDTWHHDLDVCPQGCVSAHPHLDALQLQYSLSSQVLVEELAIMDHVYATKDFMDTTAVRHHSTDLGPFLNPVVHTVHLPRLHHHDRRRDQRCRVRSAK